MIRFAHPWFLLLLLGLVPLVIWALKAGSGGRILFSTLENFRGFARQKKLSPRHWLLALRCAAFLVLIFALARPQAGKKFTEISSEGIDIFLVLDVSGSMRAMDFERGGQRVDRLSIVKEVVADFIKKRPNDRMGLIVFGTEAFTQCPLTLDHGILMSFLERVEIAMAGEATAIGQAMGVGINRMKDLPGKSKVMVLLTDGASNAGQLSPLKAAELAANFQIKTYTIAVGTTGQAPFLEETIFGKRYVMRAAEVDEKTLQQIAETTSGKYFSANNTQELEKIYATIDQLEKREIRSQEYTEYHELFFYLVALALGLLVSEVVLGQTRWRKLP